MRCRKQAYVMAAVVLMASLSGMVSEEAGHLDHFTELFDAADNDLGFLTLMFLLDGSADFYSVCLEPATEFPVDPAGGQVLEELSPVPSDTLELAGDASAPDRRDD